MEDVGILEGILGLIELGAIPVIMYFARRIKKKREMLKELDKLVQAKNEEIQSLKHTICLKELEIKMLEKK